VPGVRDGTRNSGLGAGFLGFSLTPDTWYLTPAFNMDCADPWIRAASVQISQRALALGTPYHSFYNRQAYNKAFLIIPD
jgi:hypothetical protein